MAVHVHDEGAVGFRCCLCEQCGITFDWCLVLEVFYDPDEEEEEMCPMVQEEPICFGCFQNLQGGDED